MRHVDGLASVVVMRVDGLGTVVVSHVDGLGVSMRVDGLVTVRGLHGDGRARIRIGIRIGRIIGGKGKEGVGRQGKVEMAMMVGFDGRLTGLVWHGDGPRGNMRVDGRIRWGVMHVDGRSSVNVGV